MDDPSRSPPNGQVASSRPDERARLGGIRVALLADARKQRAGKHELARLEVDFFRYVMDASVRQILRKDAATPG